MALTCATIICTKDRPHDLDRALRSLADQTRLPEQVIVIDDGQSDEPALRAIFADLPVEFVYHRKQANPGVTRSRNLGLTLAQTDVIFFFDDDVIIEPPYVAEVMKLYEADPAETVGGIGGVVTNDQASVLYALWRGLSPWGHGRVAPSGLNQCNYRVVRQVQEVEWLGGCAMSYRRTVLQQHPFFEGFGGYASAEDIEQSYRVARCYRLLITPQACLTHMQSPINRLREYELSYMRIINAWYHFSHNMPKYPVSRLSFTWLMISTVLADLALFLFPQRWRWAGKRLRGHMRGIHNCLWHHHHLHMGDPDHGVAPYLYFKEPRDGAQ